MGSKNTKRSAYINSKDLRVNCDGTTVKDRKPDLRLKSNHFKRLPTVRWYKQN